MLLFTYTTSGYSKSYKNKENCGALRSSHNCYITCTQWCRNGGGGRRGSCCPFAKGTRGQYCPLHFSTIVTKQNACSVTCKCVYISVYLYHSIPKVTSFPLQYTERIPKVVSLHSVVSLPL